MDNLHSGIIRFEVSHYQKAQGLASLRPLKERDGGKLRRSLGGGEFAVCLPPVGRLAPPRYGIMRRTQLSMKRATRKKRTGRRKETEGEKSPYPRASYDLSAAAVQNARNKDFYRAHLRGRRTLKRICNFHGIPLTRLHSEVYPTIRTIFINPFFPTWLKYPLAILWDDAIYSLCYWWAFEALLLFVASMLLKRLDDMYFSINRVDCLRLLFHT